QAFKFDDSRDFLKTMGAGLDVFERPDSITGISLTLVGEEAVTLAWKAAIRKTGGDWARAAQEIPDVVRERSWVEVGCSREGASIHDFLTLVERLRPEAIKVFGCRSWMSKLRSVLEELTFLEAGTSAGWTFTSGHEDDQDGLNSFVDVIDPD